MERNIADKVVVITGGARGIGYEIAKQFLQNEAKTIVLLDINEDEGAEAADNLNRSFGSNKALFIKCDVTKDLDRVTTEIFEKYTIDVLINNAGISNETLLRKTMEVNAIGAMECAMKFWEHMKKDTGGRGGTILNIISIYGFAVDPWLVYYKSSKHAVLGFTTSLGHPFNFNKFGVRVIGLCPGYTDTGLIRNVPNWECQAKDFVDFMKDVPVQSVDVVGEAAVEVFKRADSGTAWVIDDNKPVRQLTPAHY